MKEFSNGDALGSLLALQGLLIAAAGLLMVVMQPEQTRRIEIPLFDPMAVLRLVAVSGTLAGVGSAAAWIAVFTGGTFGGGTRLVIAVAALAAIAAMMIVTALLIFARRT